jgi:hypothetical protein
VVWMCEILLPSVSPLGSKMLFDEVIILIKWSPQPQRNRKPETSPDHPSLVVRYSKDYKLNEEFYSRPSPPQSQMFFNDVIILIKWLHLRPEEPRGLWTRHGSFDLPVKTKKQKSLSFYVNKTHDGNK